jgi:hypothetical protein
MNRKMRAKVNNAAAKARKERKPCPNVDTIQPYNTGKCDTCGEELETVLVMRITPDTSNETLH